MTIFLLRYLPSEQQHSIPGHLSVVEDKASNPGKGFGTPRLEGHSSQRVGAQVQELQVRDVGHNFTDLKTRQQSVFLHFLSVYPEIFYSWQHCVFYKCKAKPTGSD